MEYHSGGSLPLLGRPRYCPGANTNRGYLCETGHCCGETGCCTYYYELWWFWLLWTALILFSCCCAYRHRRAKLRVQQQQRQREISLLAYHGASSYPSSMLDLSFLASLKLPSYEEVAAQPSTPPPPYSSVFTTPRYPQPPRTADPHLLTQHGPLLHQALSDGPSSLSSDNSSSCSCDSCCPSSPCSSSLSAPVTYETDTSHASTPSEATPLTLDVTMETITAAATCLNEARLSSERIPAVVAADSSDADAAGTQRPITTSTSVSNQAVTVTVAVVTRAASPQPSSSAGAELPVGTEPPTIPAVNTEGQDPECAPLSEIISVSGPQTPTATAAVEASDLARTFDAASAAGGPTSVSSPDTDRTLALTRGSAGPLTVLTKSSPESLPLKLTHAPGSDLTVTANPHPESTTIPDTTGRLVLTPHPSLVTDAAPSPPLAQCHDPKVSLGPDPPSAGSGWSQTSGSVSGSLSYVDSATLADGSVPPLVLSQSSVSVLITPLNPDVQAGFSSGSGPLSAPSPCPAITIESSFATSPLTPAALSPSSPSSLPSPPLPTSLPAPALLLDPPSALHPDRGGSSSGHASSLSPSPRATQSPPKQTLFSPCVDFFEAGPVTWEDEEEQPEEKDNEEEDDEDVGADESQYRHRRLTGDSGIEVCRCRVEEEEDDEEEEDEERKEDGRSGGGGGGGGGFHDSVDCPARGQVTTEEGLRLCTPTTASTPTSEDSGKVVIVMETV